MNHSILCYISTLIVYCLHSKQGLFELRTLIVKSFSKEIHHYFLQVARDIAEFWVSRADYNQSRQAWEIRQKQ